MIKLKSYQEAALKALEAFFLHARSAGAAHAFEQCVQAQGQAVRPYQEVFPGTPSVCLRVPTGGGKTLMAAHAIGVAGRALLEEDFPVALWLTPSDAIRSQTLEALAKPGHPYRQALAARFGDRVVVCDLDALTTVGPQEIGQSCIVVVATIQAFNISDTAKRTIYSFNESLSPHFQSVAPQIAERLDRVGEEDLLAQPYLGRRDLGRIKHSTANWLNIHRPVVIVDEAHNNKTQRFFESLGRFHPSCIIEFTATPVAGNNVLYHVSAQELRAEQMIKLPIVLAEHPTGWESCLQDALLIRARLETLAQSDSQYIRPIALIQAESKDKTPTVEQVRSHLIDRHGVPADQIAVATGSQKELDGVDLFDPKCPVRFVITVEALKEGWDCSLAYVLASLQSMKSAKDVEQLLGRVLRMPYAQRRSQDDLNRAYAHVVSESFSEAAGLLKDRLVQNMGFERLEVGSLLMAATAATTGSQGLLDAEFPLPGATIMPLPDGHGARGVVTTPPMALALPATVGEKMIQAAIPPGLTTSVVIKPTTQGLTVVVPADVGGEDLAQLEDAITSAVPTQHRKDVAEQFADHRAAIAMATAPEQLGLSFAAIPQMCIAVAGVGQQQKELELVERSVLTSLGNWNLLDRPARLDGFVPQETSAGFTIDVGRVGRVVWSQNSLQQSVLNEVATNASEADLVAWLDGQARQPDVAQPDFLKYLSVLVRHLIMDRSFTLTQLVRCKFQLARAIVAEVELMRRQAIKAGFQASLAEMEVPTLDDMDHFGFRFEPGTYPTKNPYRGRFLFRKHFYPVVHDLKEKTDAGAVPEEFQCAKAIDACAEVKHWVRNIERQERSSFWLPTSSDYFYPDFVAELNDGRILVVEYKGEQLASNEDSDEKRAVGAAWELASKGRCLFHMATKVDDKGRGVFQQIQDKVAKKAS